MPQESNFYRIYKLAYKDRNDFIKLIILGLLIVSGLSLASLFSLGVLKYFSLNFLIESIVLWLITLSLLSLFFLLSSNKYIYLFSLVFGLAPFLPIFLNRNWDNNILFVSGAIIILSVFASWRIKGEANNLIELNFGRIISKGSIFLSLIVFVTLISLVYFEWSSLNNFGDNLLSIWNKIEIPGLSKISFNNKNTIDDILNVYLGLQAQKLNLRDESVKRILLEQTKNNLSQIIGIPISGKETVINLVINYFKDNWQKMSLQMKLIFYLLGLSILWSIFSIFNYIFSNLIIVFSWLLLKLLLMIKFLQIKRVGVEKEEIAFS